MKTFERYCDKDKCWWCGSTNLSGEHKIKKTDLELLYGKVYKKDDRIINIKFRSQEKVTNLQSSSSDFVKFQKSICPKCNGARSQKFDNSYKKLIEYYYTNQSKLLLEKKLSLIEAFGESWKGDILNVYRYICKHVGCRIVELGFKPLDSMIAFMNGEETYNDLKFIFQLKPYQFGDINDPVESIFLGPINLINCSITKGKDIITSFSGWYTFVNFSWNYICESDINISSSFTEQIELDVVKYTDEGILDISVRHDFLALDWAKGLENIEYYPFHGVDRDLQHYEYMKKI